MVHLNLPTRLVMLRRKVRLRGRPDAPCPLTLAIWTGRRPRSYAAPSGQQTAPALGCPFRATKGEAGETPGVSVVDDLRKENGVSSERLLESYTCKTARCRNDVPTAFLELAARQTKHKLLISA